MWKNIVAQCNVWPGAEGPAVQRSEIM